VKTLIRRIPLFISFTIIFVVLIFLGSSNNKLNDNDDSLRIFSYKVKQWENVPMVCDKFRLTPYTVKTSNSLYHDSLYRGQVLLIPNKDVTIYKYVRGANLRRIAWKFYISIKDIKVFNKNLVSVEILDEDQILPRGGYVAVPQLQEKGFIFPLMRQEGSQDVFSGWGRRRDPFNKGKYQFHTGWDILAKYEHVRAAKSGRVIFSGWLGGYGRCIIIESVDGSKAVYAHLQQAYFKKGTYAKQGVAIAISGNTGHSTGPHLHFEIRIKYIPVNPINMMWDSILVENVGSV